MLQVAHRYKQHVEDFLADLNNREYLKYYLLSGYATPSVEIPVDEWAEVHRVSLDSKGVLLGYFAADISRGIESANSIRAVNMTKKPSSLFVKDCFRFVDGLFLNTRVRRIEWSVAGNNPARKMYDRALPLVGGRFVGVMKQHWPLLTGGYEDRVIYESSRGDYENSRHFRT